MENSLPDSATKNPALEAFKVDYLLHLADNALILGHRNSEWCGHGPVLEQDIAITNISLDLIGQARNFYQYAATLINQSPDQPSNKPAPATEDTLAYLRNADEFKNCLLVELPKGDWAFTILRQFFFSTYQFYLFQQLQNSKDEQVAAIAAKSLMEVRYHLRWSSEWVIRLGDGTEESHSRIKKAIEELWGYSDELFTSSDYEQRAKEAGYGADSGVIKSKWIEKVNEVLAEATLEVLPSRKIDAGGKSGRHTPHLEAILADMQYMQRTYPGCEW